MSNIRLNVAESTDQPSIDPPSGDPSIISPELVTSNDSAEPKQLPTVPSEVEVYRSVRRTI